MSIYFIILPYIYLINEQCNLKSTIADSDFYLKFIERFYQPIWKKEYKVQMQKEDEETDESWIIVENVVKNKKCPEGAEAN